jgi:hypothetical protein
MARWLAVSSLVIVVVMSAWLRDERRAPDARSLGGVCESTSGCQEGTRCVDQRGVMAGQCSASCSDDSACSDHFGAAVLCLGADLCARACDGAADCPAGTQCNAYGWCERLVNAD